MKRLSGKVAVVTGSTSGIGRTIATDFAKEGVKVVVCGRREERGNAVVDAIRQQGGDAVFQHVDLTQPEACKRLALSAKEHFGGLDILVNNAAIFPRKRFEDTSVEFWDHVMAINLRAPFLCTQSAVPLMRDRGAGCIINIGSTHPFEAWEGLFAYAVSKGGLYTMTRKLAYKLRKDKIRVNWITVGWVLTEKEWEVQGFDAPDDAFVEKHRKNLPMESYNTEGEIADACIYLASESACRITGTDINLSAGLSIQL